MEPLIRKHFTKPTVQVLLSLSILPHAEWSWKPLRHGIHGEGRVVLICRLIVRVVVGQHPVGDGLGLAAVGRLRLLGCRVGPAP